jgi:hypothetical protein
MQDSESCSRSPTHHARYHGAPGLRAARLSRSIGVMGGFAVRSYTTINAICQIERGRFSRFRPHADISDYAEFTHPTVAATTR